ncbi:SDR family oxidoreductase [Pseudanabaena sp. FACHB-2040]|uniref:SDR family oxidoreductase n=1 Tax=Pseudanabaena sp. FACHB-2040 TaxID=2692859 RepID=UPI0016865757|nr:SDR family oxidoreductase [Pseudanabaena sp. FACHB-2040]MBD2259307.1 SDR family oxidoreductase [Pseudanabaena sp. FACHB-2040]
MLNSILVIGATGNVGSQVVHQLLATGVKPKIGVRSRLKSADLVASGAELIDLDMGNLDSLSAAFKTVDKVFWVSPFVPNMVELSTQVVKAAQQSNIQQIVRLSAMGAGQESPLTLGRWHGQIDQMVVDAGIPLTILCPNGFMQNYSNAYVQTIKTQNVFYQNLGDAAVSYIDVRDIAAVAVTTLVEDSHVGKIYELTGPESLSNSQIAKILTRCLGRTIHYANIPDEVVRAGMLKAGMAEVLVDAILNLNKFYKTGAAAQVLPTVKQVTGEPGRSFEQFVSDYRDIFS